MDLRRVTLRYHYLRFRRSCGSTSGFPLRTEFNRWYGRSAVFHHWLNWKFHDDQQLFDDKVETTYQMQSGDYALELPMGRLHGLFVYRLLELANYYLRIWIPMFYGKTACLRFLKGVSAARDFVPMGLVVIARVAIQPLFKAGVSLRRLWLWFVNGE